MKQKQVQGIYAAILTPRLTTGEVDVSSFEALLRFLVERGVQRFAVNGATGEFCLTDSAQLKLLLSTIRSVCAEAEILCGVGSASSAQSCELAAIAQDAGVQALLLPMPFFFPYEQQDLRAFCEQVARTVTLPVLLYNLPQFTSGLEADTVCELCKAVPNIIGIKDSSGSLEILRALRDRVPEACRIVGNDQALAPALQEALCDGVVSGVACVMPELIESLYHEPSSSDAFQQRSGRLDVFISQLSGLPTPWGLKFVAEARGVFAASFAQPLSPERRAQGETLKTWVRNWISSN